jgi:hypothetical protein
LVQSQYVTGSNVQTVTFSGLDGNSDRFYLLKSTLRRPVGGQGTLYSYYLRPNGATTNLSYQLFQVYQQSDAVSGQINSGATTSIYLAGGSWQYSFFDLSTYISAESSMPRMFHTRHDKWSYNGATTQIAIGKFAGRWNETSTNMTSLQVYCDRAGGIAIGSEFHLYKFIV